MFYLKILNVKRFINNINCRTIYLAFIIKSKNLKMMKEGKRKRLRSVQIAKNYICKTNNLFICYLLLARLYLKNISLYEMHTDSNQVNIFIFCTRDN